MIEFGLNSPVGVVCEISSKVNEKIDLLQLISSEEYEILLDFFCNGTASISNKERLQYLDNYLDIPLVQAYFGRHSYIAFHRLVSNGCIQFPEYKVDDLNFCEEAAEQNHLPTLKKAYEIGCHLSSKVIDLAIQTQNMDMIQFIIDINGSMACNMEACLKLNNLELVEKVFPYQPYTKFPEDSLLYPTIHNNLPMIEFVKQHSWDCHILNWDRDGRRSRALQIMLLFSKAETTDETRSQILDPHILTPDDWKQLLCTGTPCFRNRIEMLLRLCYIDDNGYLTNNSTFPKYIIDSYYMALICGTGDVHLCQRLAPFELIDTMLKEAINNNHMDMVIYLCELGCPWPTKHDAAKNNYYSILKYIHEQGCPCDKSCHKYYHSSRIPFCPV